jgi:hypothetical protein
MKKKIFVIFVCTLFITTLFAFSATARPCQKLPTTHIVKSNSPPEMPIVEIPEVVKRGHFLYIKATSTDPDGDDIYFKFDIGGHDYGWIGPFQSGKEHMELIVMLIPPGPYTLSVQAKDIHGAESEISYNLFNVIKTRSAYHPFLNLLKTHPTLFPILKSLLGI